MILPISHFSLYVLLIFDRDPGLAAIGKQIKYLEGECKKEAEVQMREWTKMTKPLLENEIKELEKKCAFVKERIDTELRLGKN